MNSQRLTKSNEKLYGREKELRTLREAYAKAKESPLEQESSSMQIVLVSGVSGSGKSRLISTAFKNCDCLHGAGKFEERQHSSKPYSALLNCISELCTAMLPNRELYAERLKTSNLDSGDLAFLSDFVPHTLQEIVDTTDTAISTKEEATTAAHSKESLQRLKYILRLFLRGISVADRPTVLVLDDLQWIDPPTLHLLQSMLSDSELQHFVFVGSFRDDEVDKDHIVTTWTDGLQMSPVNIHIGNLDVDCIHNLLVSILKVDDAKDLADLLHARTGGNILYVLQLIDLIEAEKLLSYSLSSFSWTWDLSKIKEKTSLSDNVVDVVRAKMSILSPQDRCCLKLCACLGFRFEKSVVSLVQDAFLDDKDNLGNVTDTLKNLLELGFVERRDDSMNSLKFTHDKIHHAALSLVQKDSRSRLHLSIGRLLWQRIDGFVSGEFHITNDRVLFLTADQLNLGRDLIVDDGGMRHNLARLNSAVANRAASFSAFGPAAEYAEIALSLLNNGSCESPWSHHYALVLELYTLLAEMSFCSGNFERLKETVGIVSKHAKPIEDRIRVYKVLLAYLETETKYDEFLHTLLDVLRQLGERQKEHPSRFHVQRAKRRIERRLGRQSDDQILELPMATNKNKTDAVQLLSMLFMTAIQTGRHNLNAICLCRLVELSLDYGLAPYSTVGFSTLGLLFVATNVDLAYLLAKLSTSLLDSRPEFQHSRPRTLLFSAYVRHWREPLAKLVDSCFEGYRIGMKSGDLLYAFHGMNAYSAMYFYSGLPLGPLAKDMKRFCALAEEYGQKYTLLQVLPVTQCLLNASGESTSRILDLSQGLAKYYRDRVGWNGTGKESERSYTMQMAFYCGDLDLAASLYSMLKDVELGAFHGVFFHQTRVFLFALIAMAKYTTSKMRSWKQDANQHLATIRKWVRKDRAINLAHKLMVLEAASMTMEDDRFNVQAARAAIDKAIAASSKSGFPQDAAVAALLASRSLAGDDKRSYLRQARQFFTTWGAKGIADYLETQARSGSMVDVSSSGGGGFRSRERYDKTIVEGHHHLDLSEIDAVKHMNGSN